MRAEFTLCRGFGVAAALMCAGVAVPALAEEGKLSVHGFVTQAYGITDEHQYLGIPESGTTDYRRAALQARYDVDDNAIVIQFNHRRLGNSPMGQIFDDVRLGQAFVEHRFGDVHLKAGRIPIPLGIYNEIKYVGTQLPFYRPSVDVYGEESFTSEYVDGAMLTGSWALGGGWGLDASGYAGGWDYIEASGSMVAKARAQKALGGQLWLVTPIEGLRIGVHASRYTLYGGQFRPIGKNREDAWSLYGSIDATFDRFYLRSEFQHTVYETGHFNAAYVETGVRLVGELRLHAQAEGAKLLSEYPEIGLKFDRTFDEALAGGVSYDFGSLVRLKAEYRWDKGFWSDDVTDLYSQQDPFTTRIVLVSVAATF